MKVLMLSTDRKIFDKNSAVRERMIDYGKIAEEIHAVVYTSGGENPTKLSNNVFIYPTNTLLKPLYFLDSYRIALRIIKEKNLKLGEALITTQDPFETALVGFLLKRKFNLPLQIQSHSDFLSPFFAAESFKNRLRVLLGKRLLKKADGIRVVSQRVKQSLIDQLGISESRITVLPLLYDLDRWVSQPIRTDLHKKYSDKKFIILAPSRFTVEKNIGMAIKAMAAVIEKHPDALLVIVGDGPERKKLQLQGNIVIEPWTTDLLSYYLTADLFIMTSNYEGGARAPAEAIAAGLPVVMTDVPPAGEIVKDNINGFIVPVGNSAMLAERIMEIIKNPTLLQKFKNQTRETAKSFISKEEYLLRYKKALTNLL